MCPAAPLLRPMPTSTASSGRRRPLGRTTHSPSRRFGAICRSCPDLRRLGSPHQPRRLPMPLEATSVSARDTLVEEGAALTALATAPIRKSIIVIGGGQAGLSVGYHVKRLGLDDFLIL